nr:DUF1799 domain-containing protein [Halorhodospira sp. 9622]
MIRSPSEVDRSNLAPELEAHLERREAEDVHWVWPENWAAFETFYRCQTQWRVGMSGRTGLDYTAVRVVLDLFSEEDQRESFDRLQVMEFAALEAMGERRATSGQRRKER